MNNQQRKDLATRSLIGDRMIHLLRRASGLHLLTYSQGLNEHEAQVPSGDDGSRVGDLVGQGYQFSGISGTGNLIFRKLEGLFYPFSGLGSLIHHRNHVAYPR